MEFNLSFSLNSTIFLISTVSFLFFFFGLKFLVINTNEARRKLPPGPWKLPLIGNLLQLALAGSAPHYALRDLAKKYGTIFHLQLGQVPAVIITSSQLAQEAFKIHDLALAERPDILASRIIFYESSDLVTCPYGDYWKQMRKICTTEILSDKKVRSLRSIREKAVSSLIESIRSSSLGKPINLSQKIYTLANVIACKATIKDSCSVDNDKVIKVIMEMGSVAGGFDIADLFPSLKLLHLIGGQRSKMMKIRQRLDNILDQILDEHIQNLGARTGTDDEDLVDVLLRMKDTNIDLDCPITYSHIKAMILTIFAAGTDTSATTIDFAMAEMIRNPGVRHKAQTEIRELLKGKKTVNEIDVEDMSYLKLVIKETLRLHPPVPLLSPRRTREEFEIAGYTIPARVNVIFNAMAIARDSNIWSDADSFIPERFENSDVDFYGNNFEFIPFGSGRRMCPGIPFATATIELALAQLLYHLDWQLPNNMNPEDLDMNETLGATIRKKYDLYLVPTSYSHI